MGETDIAPLNSSCGAEQEYFLIDAHFANSRPDLLLAGRTLFGAPSPKGQEFDDHYFGAIPARVQVFMQDFEDKLFRLGIPAKTHHNEVAPGQFEIAPYFEAANVAADHQQLMMTIMKTHGARARLRVPAAREALRRDQRLGQARELVGRQLDAGQPARSGKHAARQPQLPALLRRGDPRRASLRPAPARRHRLGGNDHRLGANEAPPAILSVYLGDQLEGGLQRHQETARYPFRTMAA